MSDVLAIHDLSCYGKSSLSVVAPVLESLGSECSSVPTSLLSMQTDGFDSLFVQDLTDSMRSIFMMHEKLGLGFDAVYSGYLGSSDQICIVEDMIRHYGAFTLVDPVLGDNGALYQTMGQESVDSMKHLVRLASMITPNYTEARLLTGFDHVGRLSNAGICELTDAVRRLGPEMGVITSVPITVGLANIAYDSNGYRIFQFDDIGISYPGSGDLFASLLLGLMLGGMQFFTSAKSATDIASYAVYESKRKGRERRRGVMLSPVFSEIRRRAL